MAVCPSCGSVVSDASKFCTSCGRALPASAPASPPVVASTRVCTACGADVAASSTFCTNCGAKMPVAGAVPPVSTAEPGNRAEALPPPPPAKIAPIAPSDNSSKAVSIDTPAPPVPATPPLESGVCAGCGSRLDPGARFCTRCGKTISSAAAIAPVVVPASVPEAAPAAKTLNSPTPPVVEASSASTAVSSPQAVDPPSPAEPQIYPARTSYQTQTQPARRFGLLVFILLIVIVGAGFGGWYLWGVETIIVCSPPDARVSLDDKELPSDPSGRYVIPHLSRSPHLLKVQRRGFADTLQRLDFPLSSSREWITIVLVPSRPARR